MKETYKAIDVLTYMLYLKKKTNEAKGVHEDITVIFYHHFCNVINEITKMKPLEIEIDFSSMTAIKEHIHPYISFTQSRGGAGFDFYSINPCCYFEETFEEALDKIPTGLYGYLGSPKILSLILGI